MKLLFLMHRLPCPADGGAKLRAAAQLRYLAQRHDVWCAGMLDTAPWGYASRRAQDALAELRTFCRDVAAIPLRGPLAQLRGLGYLLAGRTATEGYFASSLLKRQVMAWSHDVDFDAVFAFSSSMAPLALTVPARRRILDMDDLDSRKWAESVRHACWPMSWIYHTEARRLAEREREWITTFDASILISEREASLITDEALRRRVHVIEASTPTCIDLMDPANTQELKTPLPNDSIVGFCGAMDYRPNITGARWFADSIWPHIRTELPEAQWWVVGRSPARSIRRLGNRPGIRITGTVPTVKPYLNRMRVAVAPLRLARGVQIKVVEAMTAGKPCVVTPCVAEGLGAKAGRHLLVADSPASFAKAVIKLLTDDVWATLIARAGREFVMKRLRPGDSLARLEQLVSGQRDVESLQCGHAPNQPSAAVAGQGV